MERNENEVKDYVYLEWMLNMCQDMAAEIPQRIRSGWKAFTTIKMCSRLSWTRLYVQIFSIAPFCLQC